MQQLGLVEIGGIVIAVSYIVWLIVFFQLVRPWLMERAGRRLGVEVHESLDALDGGTYTTKEDVPLAKSGAVVLMDFAGLMLGTVGMAAAVFIPAFLIAESGAPYRWEGALTNARVSLTAIEVGPMRNGNSTARVRVVNEGEQDHGQCRIDVGEYTARNGYLHGASSYFDIAANTEQLVDVKLDALKSVLGTHQFSLRLECQNRLRDKRASVIEVVD
jgi:hypothetical protein